MSAHPRTVTIRLVAAAAAAGLGAGALPTRHRDATELEPRDEAFKSYREDIPGSESGAHGAYGNTPSQTGPSDTFKDTTSTGNNLTSGVDSLVGGSSTKATDTTEHTPTIAEHANHGDYNKLASGTPSGIRVDES